MNKLRDDRQRDLFESGGRVFHGRPEAAGRGRNGTRAKRTPLPEGWPSVRLVPEQTESSLRLRLDTPSDHASPVVCLKNHRFQSKVSDDHVVPAPLSPGLFIPTLGPVVAPERAAIERWLHALETRLWRQGLTVEVIRGIDSIGPTVGLDRRDDPISAALKSGIAHSTGSWIAARLNGRIVGMQAFQLVMLGDRNLTGYLTEYGMSNLDVRWEVEGEARRISDVMTGPSVYLGGGWKAPDIRGRGPWQNLITDLYLAGAVAAYAQWVIDHQWFTTVNPLVRHLRPLLPARAFVPLVTSIYPGGVCRPLHLGYLNRDWLIDHVLHRSMPQP